MKVYSEYKVYGPYKRKDGRMHVVLYDGKSRKTVSYPKYLVEIYLNRYLKENETVDHIDGDFNNNELFNLRVVDRNIHISQDAIKYKSHDFVCPLCNATFTITGPKLGHIKTERKRGKAGPFCSKSCAGKYGTSVQNKLLSKFEIQEINIMPEKDKDVNFFLKNSVIFE